jgi:hypothetical protein
MPLAVLLDVKHSKGNLVIWYVLVRYFLDTFMELRHMNPEGIKSKYGLNSTGTELHEEEGVMIRSQG